MLNQDSEIEVWSRFVWNLWYELNPRVRCAFGNVFTSSAMTPLEFQLFYVADVRRLQLNWNSTLWSCTSHVFLVLFFLNVFISNQSVSIFSSCMCPSALDKKRDESMIACGIGWSWGGDTQSNQLAKKWIFIQLLGMILFLRLCKRMICIIYNNILKIDIVLLQSRRNKMYMLDCTKRNAFSTFNIWSRTVVKIEACIICFWFSNDGIWWLGSKLQQFELESNEA